MNTEARIQSECFRWFWNEFPQYRGLMFHIPNGGKRTKIEAARLKAMGVVPGVPDLFLALPSLGYNGLFIEIKKPGEIPDFGKKKLTSHQRMQHLQMELFIKNGYYCVYCDSLVVFNVLISTYLDGEKPRSELT